MSSREFAAEYGCKEEGVCEDSLDYNTVISMQGYVNKSLDLLKGRDLNMVELELWARLGAIAALLAKEEYKYVDFGQGVRIRYGSSDD